MNITYKFLLDKRRISKNNHYPLKLRLYQNSKYKELGLGIFIPEYDWDIINETVRLSNTESDKYNAKINSVKNKVRRLVLLAELNDNPNLTLDEIVSELAAKKAHQEKKPTTCFITYGEAIIKSLESTGKAGNSIVYSCAVNKLKSFVKQEQLPIQNVNYKLLTDFNEAMLVEGIKLNSISVYMRTLRAIYNKAIKEGIVSYQDYPFVAFKIKNERTVNRTLTIQEMKNIIALPLLPNSTEWHWRNIFLLSFYLIGINMADLLSVRNSDIIDGRVVFRRKKTGKVYSVKLQQPASEILFYYRSGIYENSQNHILPIIKEGLTPMQMKRAITQALHNCNDYLKKFAKDAGIKKNISSYYARYTWANIARQLGYSKDMIAEGLGHEYGNRVTGIYLDNYDSALIDEMNMKVIEAVKL